MKQAIWLRFVSALIILFSTACSGNVQTPTMGPTTHPTESQPTVEFTPTVVLPTVIPPTATQTPTPTESVTPPPTQTITLFTESGGAYSVNLTSTDFVEVVDNPYFPLPHGAKWEYEISLANGSKQTDTLEVLKETRNVNGVQATVVRDTVSVGNQPVEDTFDWFAQDEYGNVWYVGESVDNYVAGVLASHKGSWEWGVDGALPGIIMWADPSAYVNEEYRQEYYVGRAEDMGQVLSVNESVAVPFGSFDQVVKTFDFSALETNAKEQKFYALGIGLIKEMDLNSNEEVALVKFTQPEK